LIKQEISFLQDFLYCATNWQIGKLPNMAKRKMSKTTTVARAKAAVAKARSARKKASRTDKKRHQRNIRTVPPALADI